MTMCDEMQKLRDMLDNRGINWRDASSITSQEHIMQLIRAGIDRNYADTTMWRTHFEVDDYNYSVINGYGSYGGYVPFTGHNLGLLECMTDRVNGGEPVGNLTADEVMQIIDGTWNG